MRRSRCAWRGSGNFPQPTAADPLGEALPPNSPYGWRCGEMRQRNGLVPYGDRGRRRRCVAETGLSGGAAALPMRHRRGPTFGTSLSLQSGLTHRAPSETAGDGKLPSVFATRPAHDDSRRRMMCASRCRSG